MSQQDAKILKDAAKLLKTTWVNRCPREDGEHCLVSAVGAYAIPRGVNVDPKGSLYSAINLATGHEWAFIWNDAPGRTKEEVLEVLKVAALIARDL